MMTNRESKSNMSKQLTHKKKRNSGLLYEFLIRTISRSLVEGDQKKSATALKILKRSFKPGTELYKEFRLINSLVRTTVSSEHVAASIINEAKAAAGSYDLKALDKEKSILIKNINHLINDENFYDQQVNEYKVYATVQTLINEWRSSDKDIGKLAEYEDQLMKWLTTEKKEQEDSVINEESPGTARLMMKVMTKKLNEKYSGVLNADQKSLMKAYIFSTASSDPTVIQKKLAEIKDSLLQKIEAYSKIEKNKLISEKLSSTSQQLLTENLDNVDDSTVTRFMLYAKLGSELDQEDGDER